MAPATGAPSASTTRPRSAPPGSSVTVSGAGAGGIGPREMAQSAWPSARTFSSMDSGVPKPLRQEKRE